jgi:hypothetical protein
MRVLFLCLLTFSAYSHNLNGQNNTSSPVTGIITITPSFLGSGVTCQGPVQTFSITINPTPGTTDPLDAVVCNGALTSAVNFLVKVSGYR